MRKLSRDWNPIPHISDREWKYRSANNPEKAKSAEDLVTEWREKYRSFGDDAVPAAFLATFEDAEADHSTGPRKAALYLDLLIDLYDNHPDLSNIYIGKKYPTPDAIAKAIEQAKNEFFQWVELDGEERKKIPNKYRVKISDAVEELGDLILENETPAHDFFIKTRTIELLWQEGFFYPLDSLRTSF